MLRAFKWFCLRASSAPLPQDQTSSWWHPPATAARRERCGHTGAKTVFLRGKKKNWRSPKDGADTLERSPQTAEEWAHGGWLDLPRVEWTIRRSPANQLHRVGQAAESAVHEDALVTLPLNNPQLAVRFRCQAKTQRREEVIKVSVSDTGSQVPNTIRVSLDARSAKVGKCGNSVHSWLTALDSVQWSLH